MQRSDHRVISRRRLTRFAAFAAVTCLTAVAALAGFTQPYRTAARILIAPPHFLPLAGGPTTGTGTTGVRKPLDPPPLPDEKDDEPDPL